MESFIRNSVIVPRESGDSLFMQGEDGTVFARLDGYLVVPIESASKIAEELRAARVVADPAASPV